MSIEKVNTAMPVIRNLPFKGEEILASKEVEVDEEKSSSMSKKIGLCAAAAVAIGGIILYARKGRTPKTSSGVSTAGGGGASSAASSTTSSGSGSSAFEPVKKFMKKLEDGTEYLFRTEERDKDGNLVKSVRYAKDGKTVERVREFKMAPAGVTDPAHNVVASEMRYGKNGEVIYKRTANADLSGYELETFVDKKNKFWGKVNYRTERDGNRFRAVETSAVVTDAETGRKIVEIQCGPKGKDDIVLVRNFDKKTGTKVVHEMQRLTDDTYKATEFGQGQSRRTSVFRKIPGQEDELLQFERYDSQGRLRESYMKQGDKEITKKIDKKGRELIIESKPGFEDIVRRAYRKGEHSYIQTFERDGGFSLCRDGVDIGDIKRSYAPKKASFRFLDCDDYELIYDDAGKKLLKLKHDSILGYNTRIEYYPNGNPKVRKCEGHGTTSTTYFDEKDTRKRITIRRGKDGRIYEVSRPPLPNRDGKTISYRGHNHWYPTKPGQKIVEHYNYGAIGRAPYTAEIYDNGKLIRAGNSTFEYLEDGIIIEENLREDYKIIYQGDLNHPIDRLKRLYELGRGYFWEKMPLEF